MSTAFNSICLAINYYEDTGHLSDAIQVHTANLDEHQLRGVIAGLAEYSAAAERSPGRRQRGHRRAGGHQMTGPPDDKTIDAALERDADQGNYLSAGADSDPTRPRTRKDGTATGD